MAPTTVASADGQFQTKDILDGAISTPKIDPAWPGARVTHSVDQTISDSTLAALAFDTEIYDTAALHDTVTNNNRVTAVKAGQYAVVGQVAWFPNGTGMRFMYLRLNGVGSAYIGADIQPGHSFSGPVQHAATVYRLSQGDYIELMVWQGSGAPLKVQAISASGVGYSPVLSLHWIGP